MKERWYTFISQTGQELRELCDKMQMYPDLIITNDYHKISPKTFEWASNHHLSITGITNRPSDFEYFQLKLDPVSITTLHGYLRLVPPFMCENLVMYNGHPGLITKYPKLKGKDPQEKAYKAGHLEIGSVVHEVTTQVDEGKIVTAASKTLLTLPTLDEYYNILRELSLEAWLKFFNAYIIG